MYYHKLKYLIPVIMLFCSCSSGDDNQGGEELVLLESFVTYYYELESVKLSSENNYIRIYESLSGEYYCYDERNNRSPENYLKYKELRNHYNDTGYHAEINLMVNPIPNRFLADIFESVEIVSDTDFDTDHPAGTSLADISLFYTLTPFYFIENGYRYFDWDNYSESREVLYHFPRTGNNYGSYLVEGINTLYPVKALASELTVEDLSLLGRGKAGVANPTNDDPIAIIDFVKLPEQKGMHIFTVTLKNTDGKEFSGKVSMLFD